MPITLRTIAGHEIYHSETATTYKEAILEAHKKHISFRSIDLRNIDLSETILNHADFSFSLLTNTNLSKTLLRHANFKGAQMEATDLSRSSLEGAVFSQAYMDRTNLSYIQWDRYTSFSDICYGKVIIADLTKQLLVQDRTIVGPGELIVYKKLRNKTICKLLIPTDAQRIGGLVGRKCRSDKAMVLEGNGDSFFVTDFLYKEGQEVKVENFDTNPFRECGAGIHFFVTRIEAEHYML